MQNTTPAAGASSTKVLDLRIYLIVAFFITCVITTVADAGAYMLVDNLILPPLERLIPEFTQATHPQGLISLLLMMPALMGRLFASILSGNAALAFSGTGLALFFLIVAALCLAAPVVAACIVFSIIVNNKIRAVHEELTSEQARRTRAQNLAIANLAHDIRTPITSIAGLSQALTDGLEPDPCKQKQQLETISQKALRVSQLTTMLLEFSQIEGGSFTLHPSVCDLCELLRSCAADLYPDIEQHSCQIVMDIPDTPCWIMADASQLARVFTNLINNALQHNPAHTTIALSLQVVGGVARVYVADTGCPIHVDLSLLTQPFSQDDSTGNTRSADGGFGLGLSIVERIVDLSGYQLELMQPLDPYTKAFVVTCDVVDPDAAADATRLDAAARSSNR
ncbi:MAG: sensor histidine kinase [Atopobiaceae bacterium]